jgi:trigger factor
MQVTTERLEDCQVNVIVELDAAEADKRLRQTARQVSRQFTVPGYRKGKAPLAAVIRTFGRDVLQQQAIEDWGQELYEQALEEVDYEPYEVGELQEVEWDPFRMTVLLPVQPELDLGDYRAVRAPYEVEPVTDEQIEEYLANLQQENAQWAPVERPAAMGDQVVLDMHGTAGEAEVMNNEEYEMLLEEDAAYPLPGFHEQIVGMSAGEDKSFTLGLPEADEDEEAAGQEATITVHLHTVKKQEVPPLDDELAMMIGDYDTLNDLKTGVREELETEAEQRAESEYLDKALDAFVEAAVKIEYPSQAVDREADFSLNRMQTNLASSGIELETYLGMLGKTRESYKQELRPAAEERLKKRLVLGEISRLEDLEVEPDEIEAEIERMGASLESEAEEFLETLRSPGGRVMVTDDLMTAKAQDRAVLIARSEALEPEGKEEELEEPEESEEADLQAETGSEAEAEGVGPESEDEAEDAPEADESEPEADESEPEPDAGSEAEAKAEGEVKTDLKSEDEVEDEPEAAESAGDD